MQDAFGVERSEISKAGGLGLVPKVMGGSGVRMGSIGSMKSAAQTGYARGQKKGLGKVSSALRGAGGAIKSSPGLAAAGGTGILATGGAAAYGLNRN